MGNRASSPSRASERSSRAGSNASPRRPQRNGDRPASDRAARFVDADEELPPADNRSQQQEMSWYQMAKAGYQELVNAIIRPPRAQYEVEALGPAEFEFVGKAFKRIDFRLLNDRGHVLECSHWHPSGWRHADQLPCVVYMHGNSSARVEALPQLSLALTLGATLVAFDFAGSGRSGGEHVSLGYYERDDLKAVIEHLRKSGQVSSIALWGRSMGAATALLHGDRDPSIAALVLDSAFADLTQLAEEMVERGRQAGLTVPGIVVKMVMRMIRGTVAKTANFNVRDLCPIKHADRTFIPALFVAGKADDFIQPHHSKQICDAYAGDKNFITVDGDHNSPRPGFLFDSVYIFLQNALRVPAEWSLDRENTVMGFPPWHYAAGSRSAAAAAAAMFGAATAAAAAGSGGGGGGGGGSGSGGLDADFADFDWDGVDLDDIGVDGNPSVGMTRARQAEFQTALFHMLAQEQNEQTPAGADSGGGRGGGGGGVGGGRKSPTAATERPARRTAAAAAAAAGSDSPPPLTDRRRSPRKASPSSRGGKGGASGGGGLPGTDSTDAVELRNGELLNGGKPRSTQEQLLVEEVEQGAEAVAAVAAALRAGRSTAQAQQQQQQQQQPPAAAAATTAGRAGAAAVVEEGTIFHSSSMSPMPASIGFATPSAAARPAMAPFSVSDTSDFEEAMSPGDAAPRRGRSWEAGGVRASQAPVAEGQESDEEGGVYGVAEVAAAAAAAALGVERRGQQHGENDDVTPHPADGAARQHATGGAGAGAAATPSSPTSAGGSDSFFDGQEPSGVAVGDGEKVAALDGTSGGGVVGEAFLGNGEAVGAGKGKGQEDEEDEDDEDEDSLSGEGVGWKRAVGLAAPNSGGGGGGGGVEELGEGSGKEQAGSPESSEPGAAEALVTDADKEWSCAKCTLLNSTATEVCLACMSPRLGVTTSSQRVP